MELKRVVITGLGALTPIGNDVETSWKNAIDGVSGAGPITHFDASLFKTQFACEVKGFDGAQHFDRKKLRQLDLYAQYAVVAARQAVDDSGLMAEGNTTDTNRVGVIVAAGIGGLHTFEEEAGYYEMHKENGPKYNPFFIPKMIADIASGHISMEYAFHGPNFGVVSACASSKNAIIAAFNTAQDTLRIVSPYFLPTHTVRKALVNAIDRGVKVQILFSREGDNALLSAGNQHFSKRLLRHGAEVFLYRGAFHHSKIMMVDGSHSMVGSANLNSRSLKWDYEASCFVFDPEVTAELNAIFEQDCTNSDIMTIDDYRQKPLGKRLLGWLANRILTPFL